MPIAFITGASSGIGRATAVALAAAGFQLVICGRRRERLAQVAAQVAPVPVHVLEFDVRDRAAVNAAVASLPPDFQAIEVLVNNAGGCARAGPHPKRRPRRLGPDAGCQRARPAQRDPGPAAGHDGPPARVRPQRWLGGRAGSLRQRQRVLRQQSRRADAHQNHAPGLAAAGHQSSRNQPRCGRNPSFRKCASRATQRGRPRCTKAFEPLRAEDVAEIIAFMVTRPARVTIAEVLVLAGAQGAATTIRRT